MSVTIRDLSKRLGLSISAVSKALNNYRDVSAETRALVQRTAEEMGYHPNTLARGLKTSRTYNVGVLFEDDNQSGLLHNFFVTVLDAFKREIERRGFDITFINHNIGQSRISYMDHCRQRSIDGVLMACCDFHDPEVIELAQSSIPCVTIDHPYPDRPCVISDNRAGIRELVRHAVRMGHTRIAMIYGTQATVTDERLSGFYDAMEECGIAVTPEYMLSGSYNNPPNARALTLTLIQLPVRPTCILMTDDYSALGGMEAITSAGLRVPEDVSVMGYDNIPLVRMLRPRLTTLAQDVTQMGVMAASRLVEFIENPVKRHNEPLIIPGRLVLGETVQDLKQLPVLQTP